MLGSYLELGLEHILDPKAYDHILFIVVICIVYPIKDWRKLLVLVTAFTIGHSISLALAVYNVVQISADVIEFLIPLTIAISAVKNIFVTQQNHTSNYVTALLFGVIHGLGFSNYLRALLGQEDSLIVPLLGFNIGVELSQIVVVVLTLACSYLCMNVFKLKSNTYIKNVSIGILIMSFWLMFQ